jgi:hypothetical protein
MWYNRSTILEGVRAARTVTRGTFHTDDPYISGATIQSSVARATRRAGFVHNWNRSFRALPRARQHRNWLNRQIHPNVYSIRATPKTGCFLGSVYLSYHIRNLLSSFLKM